MAGLVPPYPRRRSRWVVKTIGVFVPLVREVDEMLYQWDEPLVISDRRFRGRNPKGTQHRVLSPLQTQGHAPLLDGQKILDVLHLALESFDPPTILQP